jgi:hypothetical protein
MPPAARGAVAERERLISRRRRIARTQRRAVPAGSTAASARNRRWLSAATREEQQFGESTNARRVRTPPAVPPRVESNLSAAAGAAAPTEQAEGAGS